MSDEAGPTGMQVQRRLPLDSSCPVGALTHAYVFLAIVRNIPKVEAIVGNATACTLVSYFYQNSFMSHCVFLLANFMITFKQVFNSWCPPPHIFLKTRTLLRQRERVRGISQLIPDTSFTDPASRQVLQHT